MTCCGSTFGRLLAIVGLGFVLASGHSFVRVAWFDQRPVALTRQSPQVSPRPAADPVPRPDAGVGAGEGQTRSPLDEPVKAGSITLREAFELFEQGAFFLDARYEEDYLAGHVEGAFLMPAARVSTADGRADLDIVEPGGTVVIYCTGGDCDASENTAIRIENSGYSFDIRILGKGYTDWVEAGLPVTTGGGL